MNKLIPLIISIIIFSSYITVYANNNSMENKRIYFEPSLNLEASASSGFYASPGIMLSYRLLRSLSLGTSLKYSYNFRFGDSYLLGFAIIKFSTLYLGAGLSYRLTNGNDKKGEYYLLIPDKKLLFALSGGLIFRPFKLGPGWLGFNGGLDLFISSTPIIKETGNEENILGDPLATVIGGGISALINAIKINLGINYTLKY